MRVNNDEARRLLQAERERLTSLLSDQQQAVDDQQGVDAGPADSAKDITDRQIDESELANVRAQLEEVDAALQRVEDGTYGVSEVSGEPIPDERLRAVPWARRLVDEQELADNQTRAASSNRDLR
jgi:RNA polymerase-binding transcription factor DksA